MFSNTVKFIMFSSMAMLISSVSFAAGNHPVRGHVTKKGTYIAPHKQTNPNRTQRDNWSTKENVNPYTGKPGKKQPRK